MSTSPTIPTHVSNLPTFHTFAHIPRLCPFTMIDWGQLETEAETLLSNYRPEDSWFIIEKEAARFANPQLLEKVIRRTKGRKPYRRHLDIWRNWVYNNPGHGCDLGYDYKGFSLLCSNDRAHNWGYEIGFQYFSG